MLFTRNHQTPAITLGVTRRGIFTRHVRLTPTDYRRHLHIIGRSGSGKSTAIASIIVQHIQQGRGVSLIDPHGDLAVLVMQLLKEQGYFRRGEDFERIMYLDFGHPTRVPPMNVLHQPQYAADAVATALATVCLRVWPSLEGVGVTFLNIIKHAAYALIEAGLPLPAMQPFLEEPAFRTMVLSRATDPQILRFFTQRFDKWRDQTDKKESTENRLDLFTFSPRMRAMLSQRGNLFDCGRIMQEGRSVIYNLSALDEEQNNFVAAFIFHGYERAARARSAIPEESRVLHFLFADEFQNFTMHRAKALEDMLSGARKFRLFLGLAHQNFGQMDDRLKQALQNAETLAFKLNRDDAVWMAPRLVAFDPKQVKHIVEDEHAKERTHPVFSSMPEQFEEMARELEDLSLGNCYIKFDSRVQRIVTRPFPKPATTYEQMQPIMQEYARRYLVEIPPAEEPTPAEASQEITIFKPGTIYRRVPRGE